MRTKKIWSASLGIAVLAVAACSSGESTLSTSEALASLYPLASCGAVETNIRQAAIDEMNQRIDENLASAVKYASEDCYESQDAGAASSNSGSGGGSPTPPSAPQDESSGSGGGSGGTATSVSHTNNQVQGVDEADFVKNDDKFIYVANGSTFKIIEAWPAPGMHELSRVDVEGTARKLFVLGNTAVVYSAVTVPATNDPDAHVRPSYGTSECTYGYDCEVSGDGTATVITVFDVSNKSAPAQVRSVHLNGSFISARRIGEAVHTVVTSPGLAFTGLSYYPDNGYYGGCHRYGSDAGASSAEDIRASYEALREKNAEIIRSTPLGKYFPSIEDTAAPGAFAGTCKGFYASSMPDGSSFTSVVSLDLAHPTPVSNTTVVSRPGAIYASDEALYMAVTHTRRDASSAWFDETTVGDKEATSVHKFHLGATPGATSYQGSGLVTGHVLNQFSMDEHEGKLRVATTTGHAPSPSAHSTVTVLQQGSDKLETIGVLDDIAPSEDIRSVRFDGPRGFIVTFKKTDPLFVLDLSKPTKPTMLAELKIPGFSTYMHMMDATHLLTIGYDANDQGTFAWFAGVRLQIFDVANPTAPQLLHTEVIGTRGSSSEALTNHLAFNYFKERNLLALPMTICEGGTGGGDYGTKMTFSGLMVYDVTVANGFALRGKVAHPQTASGGYNDASCSNWWTQASSEVKRSVFMDQVVFSISEKIIKANGLNALSTDIAQVSIQ